MKHFNHETIRHKKYWPPLKKETIVQQVLNVASSKLRRQFYLSMLLCLSLFTNAFAQETWIGAADGDWTNNANWLDNTAPINGTISGVLTIQAGAANAPATNFPTSITAIQLVVRSPFTIPSGSTVDIDNTSGVGDGVITSMSGTHLTVIGTLNVNNAHDNGLEIGQDGTQLFNLGTISVNGSNAAGILLVASLRNNAAQYNSFDNQNCLVISNSGIDAINNGAIFENSNKITITAADANGINNTGVFINDSLANLTINEVIGDGIITDSIFNNDGGTITIGNGNLGDIGNHGINITGGTFNNNNSTVSPSGGMITINGVAGDGINNTGILENGVVAGDAIGIIMIDNINGNGINLNDGSTLLNQIGSSILIGQKGIVNLQAIRGSAAASLETSGTITATAILGSIDLMSLFTNMAGSILTINQPTNFLGGLVNDGIIKSSAPANSVTVTGAFTNNGIIIDPNNSFGIDRDNPIGIANDGGAIIIPDTLMCYTDTIAPFLITGSTQPDTLPFLPSPTFTMLGNSNAATFDAANNRLILNEVQSLMNFSFDILHNGVSTGQVCTTSLSFENLPTNFLACKGNLQVTLLSGCQTIIHPSMLLATDIACDAGYEIGIVGETMGDSLILDASFTNQTINVMVTNPLGNSCWTSVLVQDKTGPQLVARDTFAFCSQSTSPDLLGFPIAIDDCGGTVTFTYIDSNVPGPDCGLDASNPDTTSIITRLFTGTDQFGNTGTSTQTIYILRPTIDDVRFPSSLIGSDALECSSAQTAPDSTGKPFFIINGETILVEAICKFGVDLDEKVSNLGCTGKSRIVRTWTIWDWCHLSAGNGVKADTQVIDIIDRTAPTFDSLRISELQVLSVSAHKCMANVKPPIPRNVGDLCSGASYQILGPTGTINNNPLDSFINVPLGESHTLEYIFSDSCGNQVRDTLTFQLRDNTAPLALAEDLTINLVDGVGNTWVYASSFDGGSTDNCGAIDSILISKDGVNFDERIAFECSDIGTQILTLKVIDNSGNVSTAAREVTITDTGGHCPSMSCATTAMIDSVVITLPSCDDDNDGGLSIFANVPVGVDIEYSIDSGAVFSDATSVFNMIGMGEIRYIFIREKDQPDCWIPYARNPVTITECDILLPSITANIAGHIQNEKGEMVEAVNISIGGYEMTPETTDANGTFSFESLPLNGNYRITPEKDMNYSNGITTFDIVLLSKHVLGIKQLDSPYKLIAADVNHSGSISAYDMVLLRQVILGMKDDFPNNTSWRFIDADYEFFNPENPFLEKYPEAYEITNLAGDRMTLDFVAVKIGDLNNSAAANQFMTAESRNTTTPLSFQITEQVKKAGETITVDFKSSNFKSILGYQFGVDFDGNALAFEQLLIGDKLSFENFNLSMIHRGVITTSWNESEAVDLAANEVLFSLVFKAKESLRLSEVLQLGSNITPAEAYTETEEIIGLNLAIAEATTSHTGIKLYQNKPNPFTGETLIGFDLSTASTATMTILDMSGKVVKVIKGEYDKGYNQIIIDGKAFTEHGMFYYQLATQNGVETKKMILLKQ